MSQLHRVCKTLGSLGLILALPTAIFAQTNAGYIPYGTEYAPAGNLLGDQIYPDVAVTANGGYAVWEDNITDGSGYGISAVRLDSSFSPMPPIKAINQITANDQENPRVAMLKNGGAVIVWQGGKQGFQHIYAAFLSSSGTFLARDVPVNVATNFYQRDPAVAVLSGGNVVITWSSMKQDGDLLGVYAREFNAQGQPLGTEFRVNQVTAFNQRSPAVAALNGGGFVLAWVSEQQRMSVAQAGFPSVDIYARLYDANANASAGEFLVNNTTNICANPAVAGAPDGTFTIAWSQKDLAVVNNSWDVYMRPFSGAGVGGTVQRVNTQQYGEQYVPRIAVSGSDYLIIWTSLGQDGSMQGVYGQFYHGSTPSGGEFLVNTTRLNQQEYPSVASDGNGRFLAVWSSFNGLASGMDVEAQRYATYLQPLTAPATPTVGALDSYTLSVTWPPLVGMDVDHWNLYLDTNTVFSVTTNYWQNEGLTETGPNDFMFNVGSTHYFQVSYVLVNGRQSPLSPVASGKTWGVDRNFDGLPDDWETLYWGTNKTNWPKQGAETLLAPGVTALMVFQWGANPLDPGTWLTTSITHDASGYFLVWNTIPGFLYQIQTSSDLNTWTNAGGSRYASGTTDKVFLGLSEMGYYRVVRVTY